MDSPTLMQVTSPVEDEVIARRRQVKDRIRENKALSLAPKPINYDKIRCAILFRFTLELATSAWSAWYLARRQKKGVKQAELYLQRRYKRFPQLVKMWEGVSHAVDIGNSVKNEFERRKWLVKGNWLVDINNDGDADEQVAEVIDRIIEANKAVLLNEIEQL